MQDAVATDGPNGFGNPTNVSSVYTDMQSVRNEMEMAVNASENVRMH